MTVYTAIPFDTISEAVSYFNNTYTEWCTMELFQENGKVIMVIRTAPLIVEVLGEVDITFTPEDEEDGKVLMA